MLENETTLTELEELKPNNVLESELTVKVDYVGTMPFVPGPGLVLGFLQPNLGSPVTIDNKLYLIDQNDAIYRLDGNENNPQIQQIFNVSEAPNGLTLDNRESILNITSGNEPNSIYLMLTSGTEPTTDIPIYRMPDPLPGVVGIEGEEIADLYRIESLPESISFLTPPETRYQVLYEYELAGDSLIEPRAIAAFETQSGGPNHSGGGMVTLPDGRILFATGDALTLGADGRTAPQDPNEHVGKLLIVDPEDGSFEVAAQGVRNIQHIELVQSDALDNLLVGFADIGGVTAEEINYIDLEDLLDTSVIENFGWGRNSDGFAREGTFYIGPGIPLILDTEPPVNGLAPSPELGFIQPQAQYGRNDPNGGVAVSGPVTSPKSFDSITGLFSDLSSGIVYATTDPLTDTDVDVFKVNLIDENDSPIDSLQDLVGGRADPRFFQFPDGTAGVLLETTGDFYRLTEEVSIDNSNPEIIDFTSFTVEIITASSAGFENIGGFYQAIDREGTVIDPLTGNQVSVGDEGYEAAALANSVVQLGEDTSITLELDGGFVYVPYLLANGEQFFTAYAEANADGLNHVQSVGENSFGFEDLLGGGDNDFDDYVISFNII